MTFRFADNPFALPDDAGVRTVRVAAGLDKEQLLTTLAAQLEFPAYFGRNWDAADECLRDLSWIPERRVRLLHAELPAVSVYLAILRDALVYWQGSPEHQLEVVFPSAERARVGT